MSNELKHVEVICHMAKNGFKSVEGSAQYDRGMFIHATDSWNPITHPDAEWRIKLAKITYTVYVPEPLRIRPKDGEAYWYLDCDVCCAIQRGYAVDESRFNMGNIWGSEDKAQAALRTLFGPLRAAK